MTIFEKIKELRQAVKEHAPEIMERLKATSNDKVDYFWIKIEADGSGSFVFEDKWGDEIYREFEPYLNDNWAEIIEEQDRNWKEYCAKLAKQIKLKEREVN